MLILKSDLGHHLLQPSLSHRRRSDNFTSGEASDIDHEAESEGDGGDMGRAREGFVGEMGSQAGCH